MAADSNFVTVEQIVNFLKENGGKVNNMDLIEHFKTALPDEPERRAAARLHFKTCVNNVALVRPEDGVKYVCLRKKHARERENSPDSSEMEAGPSRYSAGVRTSGAAGGGAPGSGYGSDNQVRFPHFSNALNKARGESRVVLCSLPEDDMGNRGSLRKEEKKVREAPPAPKITVTEASPLPAEGSAFTMTGPVHTSQPGQADCPSPAQIEQIAPNRSQVQCWNTHIFA